jgi:hypothetical protein
MPAEADSARRLLLRHCAELMDEYNTMSDQYRLEVETSRDYRVVLDIYSCGIFAFRQQ